MKPRIKLGFSDYTRVFNPRDNYFTRLLGQKYTIELSEQPDFLLYSSSGSREVYRRHKCIRIFFTGENERPDFSECDYAFTFDFNEHPNHYRLPLYGMEMEIDVAKLVKQAEHPRTILARKTRFCNFLYSNRYCRFRNEFFHRLSQYKRVDAGGRLFNNIGGRVSDKLEFLRPYKFTIAFENASHPGYTTEKIAQPMLVNSLPIYWGNPLVHRDFNPASFLNYAEYGSPEALIDRVIQLDRDDELYCQYLAEPWYHGNRVNAFVEKHNVLAQFERIFSTSLRPVAAQAPPTRTFFFEYTRQAKKRVFKNWRRARRWARYYLEQLNGSEPDCGEHSDEAADSVSIQ